MMLFSQLNLFVVFERRFLAPIPLITLGINISTNCNFISIKAFILNIM